MTDNDNDRYQSMPSHHPNILFMVWDYYDNTSVAFCETEEKADRVATALNATTTIRWSEAEKRWVGEQT
jgi:hypothetical protein